MKFYRFAEARIRIRDPETFEYKPNPIIIRGLRISFTIIKSLSMTANPASIKIWNLSGENRNAINNFGDQITLYAGYVESELNGSPQILYIGDTIAASHIFEPPEIVTVLECGDGDRYLNNSRVSVTFAANSQVRVMLKTIADQMGIELVEFASTQNLIYREGFKHIGMGKEAIDIICNRLNLQGSVQNNQLQVIPINGTILQAPINVNQNNGMQGIPQRFTSKRNDLYESKNLQPTGYKVNAMLNPLILPGSQINLESTHIAQNKGVFKALSVRHDGDTYGPIWTTQMELAEIKQ